MIMKTKQILMLTLLLLGILLGPEAQAYYNSTTGRWLSRDPVPDGTQFVQREVSPASEFIQRNGPSAYSFVRNHPPRYVDPLGLRVFVMAPDVGGLDATHFADYVLNGLQRIIGDCAKLQKRPVIRQVETGMLFWRRTESRLIAWEIYFTDENSCCAANSCWKTLKGALGDNLPRRDIMISRGDRPIFIRQAAAVYATNGVSQVGIYEGINVNIPELDSGGNVVWNRTPFDVVLWHEAMGHGYLGLGHPNNSGNQRGGRGPDPTIVEENKARNCLRLQGVSINDRVPTYYGWGRGP